MRKLCCFLVIIGAAAAQNTIVRPKMTNDVLVNPGMGIQTFQRYNRQAINPGLRWSEVGPEGKVEDAPGKVDFPDSSVAYVRWFWSQLEPERGKFRWDILDTALDEARQHGQRLAIRLMPYDQKSPMPEWYQNSGARRANKPTDKDGKIWSPDSADPFYIKNWGAIVKEAGRRYDGHPYLDSVDISTFGYWGEGWGPYPPDWPTQKLLTDQWFDAFKRTPLLMNFDVEDTLIYSTGRGAGWRLDCWGDMGRQGRDFAHMLDRYPQGAAREPVKDAWQHAPVSLESCGTPGSWFVGKYDLPYILDQALRWHVSTVNLKSTAIPEEWKKQFEEFEKKAGYRFALRRLEYPRTVKTGRMMPVSMWWLNSGVAPVYFEYTLALELRGPGGSAVLKVPVDVRKWQPGDAVYDGSLYVDDHLKPGAYRVRVAMLDPRTGEPAIKLAIEGRQPDGWYDLGELKVE
jgi:hypothetical protein